MRLSCCGSARQLLADLNSLNGRTFYYNVKANGDLKVSGGTMVAGAATGGYITGPGTATSDSILARLSNGEFVQRTAAVDYYGVKNALLAPGYRSPDHLRPEAEAE